MLRASIKIYSKQWTSNILHFVWAKFPNVLVQIPLTLKWKTWRSQAIQQEDIGDCFS